ncbi:membrane protein [Mycobacterium phage Aminay]|uniref:Membrane protein n=1 Tax=Mycobacterium phage Aminay TaxID=2250291 RepID=A0A345KV26_9CAUD|nr:membrane protein [Mycobacterium phage Aminay]AXH46878.1 membrane protein [Mycobacterium phage Aminay]
MSNIQPSPAGWYPDPYGAPRTVRYFDGGRWTDRVHVEREPQATVIEGPNHVLHAVLTLLTFPLCGGWAWVWLIVAANNRKRVRNIY